MKKIFKERKIHIVLVTFFLGFFLGVNMSLAKSADDASFKYIDYFHFVYQTIKLDYVEETNPKEIFYGAINGMLNALGDPYSRFLDEEEYGHFFEQVTGEFVGIGVEITVKNGEVIVITPLDGGPAKKVGIESGDRIVKINKITLNEENLSNVIKQMKGKSGTSVKLSVVREGFPEELEFDIERAPIKVSAVKYGLLEERANTGYIKITNFYNDTHLDVRKSLLELKKQHIDLLVLDLRNNPGGNMDTSIQIADYFLPPEKIVVSTKGRSGSGVSEDYKTQTAEIYKGKLIVLLNGGSASASEILAGALRDNKRAKILGEKSFGKALVQRVIDIEKNKSGFALTIRKYYTPSGAMIHKKGISPDIYVAQDTIPKADRKNLGRILNDQLIQDFVISNNDYTPTNVKKLVGFLNNKNLPVSEKVAAYYLKQEVFRDKPSALYDLEFDNQLQKAIETVQ